MYKSKRTYLSYIVIINFSELFSVLMHKLGFPVSYLKQLNYKIVATEVAVTTSYLLESVRPQIHFIKICFLLIFWKDSKSNCLRIIHISGKYNNLIVLKRFTLICFCILLLFYYIHEIRDSFNLDFNLDSICWILDVNVSTTQFYFPILFNFLLFE